MATKPCTKCGEEKPPSEFWKDASTRDGLRSSCKKCLVASNQKNVNAYRARNPEVTAEQKKNWRLANPEKVRLHKSVHHQLHREQIVNRVSEWRKKNPDLKMAQSLKRRSLLAGAAGCGYTKPSHIRARVDLYGGKCFYCGMAASSIDHRIPLSRGGSHLPANLVPACKSCNSRKHNKTEREFREVMKPLYGD